MSGTDPLSAVRDAAYAQADADCVHDKARRRCKCRERWLARALRTYFLLVDNGWTVRPPASTAEEARSE
jgi:hypothetical protein